MLQNESQVAFITGASSGIGRAIAVKFAKEGYDVIIIHPTDTSTTTYYIVLDPQLNKNIKNKINTTCTQ